MASIAAKSASVSVDKVLKALDTVDVYPAEEITEALASKSLNKVTILGVRVVTAAKISSDSAEVKVLDEVASVVAVVIADSRESTVMARASDWERLPVYAVASLVRVATSELMLEISERTVAAVRLETGRAKVREEERRREMMVLVSCILKD